MKNSFKLRIPGRPPAKSNSYRIITIKGIPRLVPTKAIKEYEASIIDISTKYLKSIQCVKPLIPSPEEIEVALIWHRADYRRKDLDNITKSIKDGLTKGGIWSDDSQVVRLLLTSVFDTDGVENEWVDIYIRSIGTNPSKKKKASKKPSKKSCISDVVNVQSVSVRDMQDKKYGIIRKLNNVYVNRVDCI